MISNFNEEAQNILITYGQPKVGSETFAKEFTNIMNNQIYRIARPKDLGTLFPFIDIVDVFFKLKRIIDMAIQFSDFCKRIIYGNYIGAAISAGQFILNFKNFMEENSFLFQDRSLEDKLYSQTGGLYMINDDTNTVYHCDDFYHEKRDHF